MTYTLPFVWDFRERLFYGGHFAKSITHVGKKQNVAASKHFQFPAQSIRQTSPPKDVHAILNWMGANGTLALGLVANQDSHSRAPKLFFFVARFGSHECRNKQKKKMTRCVSSFKNEAEINLRALSLGADQFFLRWWITYSDPFFTKRACSNVAKLTTCTYCQKKQTSRILVNTNTTIFGHTGWGSDGMLETRLPCFDCRKLTDSEHLHKTKPKKSGFRLLHTFLGVFSI